MSRSRISSTRLLNFGKIDRWLVTMTLGRDRSVAPLLLRLTVVQHGVRLLGVYLGMDCDYWDGLGSDISLRQGTALG